MLLSDKGSPPVRYTGSLSPILNSSFLLAEHDWICTSPVKRIYVGSNPIANSVNKFMKRLKYWIIFVILFVFFEDQ